MGLFKFVSNESRESWKNPIKGIAREQGKQKMISYCLSLSSVGDVWVTTGNLGQLKMLECFVKIEGNSRHLHVDIIFRKKAL